MPQQPGSGRDRPIAAAGNQHIDVVAPSGGDQAFAQLRSLCQIDGNLMAGIGEGRNHLLGDPPRIGAPKRAGMNVHHDVDAHPAT